MNTKPKQTFSPEAIEKMRLAKLGKKLSPETRKKMSLAGLGRQFSPETREKIRKSKLGKKHSTETREKIRKTKTGTKLSPETRKKMSLAKLGKKQRPGIRKKIRLGIAHTPEAIEKMRLAHLGKNHSLETREKISLANQYDPVCDKGKYTVKCCIDPNGIVREFESLRYFIKTHPELFDPKDLELRCAPGKRRMSTALDGLSQLIYGRMPSWKGWSAIKEGKPKPPPVSIRMLQTLNQLQKL